MSKSLFLKKNFNESLKNKISPLVLTSHFLSSFAGNENEALAQSSNLKEISEKIKTKEGINKLYGGYGKRCMLVVGQVERIGDTYHSSAEVEAGREFNIDIYCDGNGQIVANNSGFEGNSQRTKVFTSFRYTPKFDSPGEKMLTFKAKGVDRFGEEYMQDLMVKIQVKESKVRSSQLENVRQEVNNRINTVHQVSTNRINEIERREKEGKIEITPNVQFPFPEKDELNAIIGYGASLRYVFPAKVKGVYYGNYYHEEKSVVRPMIGVGFNHYLIRYPISDSVKNKISGLDTVKGGRTLVQVEGGVKFELTENFNLNMMGTLGVMNFTMNNSELAQNAQTKTLLATPGGETTTANIGLEFGLQGMINQNFGVFGEVKGVKLLRNVPLEAGQNPSTGAPAYWTLTIGSAFRL